MNNRLRVEDFGTWEEYYFTYQYNLARDYYIPMFEQWGISSAGLKVLDVGCGDGGFTAALADWGATCVGVEIRPFKRIRQGGPRLTYKVADITAADAGASLGGDYSLVILRDVIEHIPAEDKAAFLKSAAGFMGPSGRMLVTFPPYYSPFGLHQQAVLKTALRKVPFLTLIPTALLRPLMRAMGESEKSVGDALEITRCRMTIGGFRRLVNGLGLRILGERFYLIRPSHEIRYGWKTRDAGWGGIPVIRELFVLGTVYLLGRKTG